jgi:hypothetical protein
MNLQVRAMLATIMRLLVENLQTLEYPQRVIRDVSGGTPDGHFLPVTVGMIASPRRPRAIDSLREPVRPAEGSNDHAAGYSLEPAACRRRRNFGKRSFWQASVNDAGRAVGEVHHAYAAEPVAPQIRHPPSHAKAELRWALLTEPI